MPGHNRIGEAETPDRRPDEREKEMLELLTAEKVRRPRPGSQPNATASWSGHAGRQGAPTTSGRWDKRVSLYLEARNRTDAASAQNLANSLDPRTGLQNAATVLAATPGSLLAGAPHNIVGGMKLAF